MEISQIKKFLHPKHHEQADDIIKFLTTNTTAKTIHINQAYEKPRVEVPPLLCDLPLSYRSGQGDQIANKIVESTATPISGYICEYSSTDQRSL